MAIFLLNFKKEFAPRVESGEKCQTIRCNRRDGRRPQPGDTAKLYTGLRTRDARLLRAAPVAECLAVRMHLLDRVIIVDGRKLEMEEAAAFAKADGFECVSEMMQWFLKQHQTVDFDGFCVRWTPAAATNNHG